MAWKLIFPTDFSRPALGCKLLAGGWGWGGWGGGWADFLYGVRSPSSLDFGWTRWVVLRTRWVLRCAFALFSASFQEFLFVCVRSFRRGARAGIGTRRASLESQPINTRTPRESFGARVPFIPSQKKWPLYLFSGVMRVVLGPYRANLSHFNPEVHATILPWFVLN